MRDALVGALAIAGSVMSLVGTLWALLKEWVSGPRLQIDLSPLATGSTRPVNNAMRYRHLRVRNKVRRWPAHDVRVYLTRLVERRADGPDVLLWDGLEVRMLWQWERQNEPSSRTIGASATCDLISVTKSKNTTHVEVIEPPWNFDPELAIHKRYVLTFVARADEADSPSFQVEVTWDGDWGEDRDEASFFRDHCLIKATTPATLTS